jgi:radical SAM superfamily enzyme YgiQ (UPF0313 family)
MKVLVLNPPAFKAFTRDWRCQSDEDTWLSAFPPVMLAGIAGAVRKKYDVKLIDAIGSRLSFDECGRMAKDYNPDFIVINTSMPTIEGDMRMAAEVKKTTNSRIIVYGEFVTSAYKEVLKKYYFIDYVVRGEAETPIMNILKGKARNSGIASRSYNGGIWQEPELDKLTMPAYDLLPPYYYPLKGKRWMFIRSGRGCPYNCLFCVVPKLSGRKLRYHSVDYMIRQIRFINNRGIYYFMLWDDIATYDKKRMLDFCIEMKRTGLYKKNKWACTTRVDRLDEALAKNMKEAGCFIISLGIESASQKVLNLNRKGIKVEDSTRAVNAARKYGIKAIGHFIIGLPGDNKKTINETISFAKKLKLSFAQFYTVATYRGSELYEKAQKEGWLKEKGYAKIDQARANVSYSQLSDLEIEQFRRKAYLRFYLRPRAIYSLSSSISLVVLLKMPLLIKKFFKWVFK